MTNNFLNIAFLAFLAVFPLPSYAQTDACQTDYELIFKLRDPEEGTYNVWDAVYGLQDKQERFTTGLVPESGNVIAAGERFVLEEGERELILAQFDSRGRTIWEKSRSVAGLRAVVKMLSVKGGYVVVGNKEEKTKNSIWLGFFKEDGTLVSEQNIRDPKGKLAAQDMIASRDGKGFVLAVFYEGQGGDVRKHAMLFKLDAHGKPLSDRAYTPGPENKILGLDPAGPSDYIATGYIYGEDGRKTGWVMRLDAEGSVIWQRQYPRGRAASLKSAQDYLSKFILVTGEAEPSGKGDTAGWLMVIDNAAGDIGWQRYFTGSYGYEGQDVLANNEGLITVMLQAQKPSREDKTEKRTELTQDHVRLLTLNPRGALFISDEFFNAEGSHGAQMILGQSDERIIIGSSNMVYQIEGPTQSEPPRVLKSLDGWVAAATAMEPYEDPCLEPYNFLP